MNSTSRRTVRGVVSSSVARDRSVGHFVARSVWSMTIIRLNGGRELGNRIACTQGHRHPRRSSRPIRRAKTHPPADRSKPDSIRPEGHTLSFVQKIPKNSENVNRLTPRRKNRRCCERSRQSIRIRRVLSNIADTRWRNRIAYRDQIEGTTEACCYCCPDTRGVGCGVANDLNSEVQIPSPTVSAESLAARTSKVPLRHLRTSILRSSADSQTKRIRMASAVSASGARAAGRCRDIPPFPAPRPARLCTYLSTFVSFCSNPMCTRQDNP